MNLSFFSLAKSRNFLRQMQRYYKRKAKSLDEMTKESVQNHLEALRLAILKKDTLQARKMAEELEKATQRLQPKTFLDRAWEFFRGLGVALIVAVLIRTMWFELYTIPSGSMRPTLKEEDYLIVSKTDYGVNVPLQVKHFYFDESLVKRGSIVVFNGKNMDIADNNTVYFYLFPGKKQFVKRLIGKPGDTIYFQGGKVYGIDRENNPISDFSQNSWFEHLEHIPFIRFEGKTESAGPGSIVFCQMNQPVASLTPGFGGKMLVDGADHYSDIWGMKHFAMARLLTRIELALIHPEVQTEDGLLYLELAHHPALKDAQFPNLHLDYSIIPLQQRHLDAIAKNMTTCRFQIKNGVMSRVGWSPKGMEKYMPTLPRVEDGVYEIQSGEVFKLPFPRIPLLGIFTNGYVKKLPDHHPLHASSADMIHRLFNLGFEPIKLYNPLQKNQRGVPSRYAYFRDNDLYLMGGVALKKGDPILKQFVAEESKKAFGFVPHLPPTIEEIKTFGLKVPEKMYLVLGDNHAMSADSREFGFVPENNLKGGVNFLFSPPGSRWGFLPQPPLPRTSFPNVAIWILFIGLGVTASYYIRKKMKKPLEF